MRTRFIATLILAVTPAIALAGNLLHIDEATLKFQKNWPIDPYGLEFKDWRQLATDPTAMTKQLQPLAVHGVNTVVFSLQQPNSNQAFYSPDGKEVNPELAERFSAVTMFIRDHYVGTIVSLFSADREHWLESEEAYRQAVQSTAKLLKSRHSVIFVIGDLFRTTGWPEDAPYPMDDADKVVELARLIKQAHQDALVAVPAAPFVTRIAGQMPHLLVAQDANALGEVIANVRRGQIFPCKVAKAAIIPADRLFPHPDNHPSIKTTETIEAFMQRVRQIRTATQPPNTKSFTPRTNADGWEDLFNGDSLSKWTTLQDNWAGWSIEDGTIKCAGIGGTWLRSREKYHAFQLQLEFKISKNGNSGVFLWSSLDARSSRFGMEMQIRGLNKKKTDGDTTGAIYDVLPPAVDAALPPGEWNRADILCTAERVTIRINGKLVQDFNPNELPRTKDRLRDGYIGLQDHNDPVSFRNIKIKQLPSTTQPVIKAD